MYVISGVLLKSPGGRHVSRPDDVIYHIDVAYTHFSDSSPKVRYKEEEERQGSILNG